MSLVCIWCFLCISVCSVSAVVCPPPTPQHIQEAMLKCQSLGGNNFKKHLQTLVLSMCPRGIHIDTLLRFKVSTQQTDRQTYRQTDIQTYNQTNKGQRNMLPMYVDLVMYANCYKC